MYLRALWYGRCSAWQEFLQRGKAHVARIPTLSLQKLLSTLMLFLPLILGLASLNSESWGMRERQNWFVKGSEWTGWLEAGGAARGAEEGEIRHGAQMSLPHTFISPSLWGWCQSRPLPAGGRLAAIPFRGCQQFSRSCPVEMLLSDTKHFSSWQD